MHTAALEWIGRHAPQAPCRVVDVGGRDINGTPRGLFHPGCEYTVVDVIAGPNVDVVGDFVSWDCDPVDVVVCAEVAEHTPAWPDIVVHARELLVAGGVFIFTAAGSGRAPHSAVDGADLRDGEWYANLERDELSDVLAVFDGFEVDEHGSDIRAVAWVELVA